MSRPTRRVARAAAVALVAGLALGCGSSSAPEVAPARVDTKLAPAAVGTDLKLYENRKKATVAAFAQAGERTLVSDGRIWEIRRADRLIGALQITTVLPTVDLTKEETRATIVHQIIPGTLTRIRIGDVEVYTAVVNDKAVFLWFGADLYEVLQIKDSRLAGAYDTVATAVIEHQATVPAWKPLPPDIVKQK
jgi:hypothetical protein